jgi:hypothetical protein
VYGVASALMVNVQVATWPSGTTLLPRLNVPTRSTLQAVPAQSVSAAQLGWPFVHTLAEVTCWFVGGPEIAGLIVHAADAATVKTDSLNRMSFEVATTLAVFLVSVMGRFTTAPGTPDPDPTSTEGGAAPTEPGANVASARLIRPSSAAPVAGR